ncbi:uncharacterized protein OGAPODRAFT_17301 [Ogataea polymorpha]|uniref:uncharacterized protein n=1 Tax=Ogataea polymorpha TaxID=460523 RepID=UPI0007F383FA|nr:uncharacterized protein OGAPODRAFT_17301 [Ogataea polymorpha]OBA14597.1 hypothetical protein OGAPODRAFT_17301 [Ogataea polymorpha]
MVSVKVSHPVVVEMTELLFKFTLSPGNSIPPSTVKLESKSFGLRVEGQGETSD